MKTILATAYAINPYKGSEDGMGWNFVAQMARFSRVIAITRENNRPYIDKFMRENPADFYQNIQFLYFDLPAWARFWKKGSRGAMIYYLMWQKGVINFIRKQNIQFDIVHNLNFHNDWTPSYLWQFGKPFVWGPIGHHNRIPFQYLQSYSRLYWLKDELTWLVKKSFWNASTGLNDTIANSNHILCMNAGVSTQLQLPETKYSVVPSVATQDCGWLPVQPDTEQFTVISAGRLVPLKGFDLAIAAFAQFVHQLPAAQRANCKFKIVGSGEEKHTLMDLCESLQVVENVEFISWIDRQELLEMMKMASVFLFPSHEGAGMVVAEALSFGLPVVCLDNDGPGEFIDGTCGIAVPISSYESTVEKLGNALTTLFVRPDKRKAMRLAARKRFENHFHWDVRGRQLQEIYEKL
ncbi:Glycosyltransferase involved in cell wall bisynthesis [Flexibacter flexilis DSM 6793]|uniref:Glycosyltransferase involved in cell wall bisynthesis n=1 Tax=Flexibacter flexilis DSM 6793 TaxID=927664 RepID=A0A1I1L2D9_9BACT|nr:glycosyltransferase [Flexibacter flexilis]SFC67161.1 Glycosyltransferase involved in cell wall bisynthesis [Flexibacter flexilis DSM 6793]